MSSSPSGYRITLTLCLLSICIIAALITASVLNGSATDTPASAAEEFPFCIKASGDRIHVYQSGKSEALYKLDTPLYLLPQADQSDLQEGIYIPDENTLRQIIEDFEG